LVSHVKTLFDSVDHLQSTLTFHRERHSVLAGNVANVDTPGYKPFDLNPPASADGLTASGDLGMAKTDGAHLGTDGGGGSSGQVFQSDGDSAGADGNAVNLERELAKIDANRVRYQTSAELVSRRLALLKYAATDGNG
jgi:flagellar basal-body rod protein FlgB